MPTLTPITQQMRDDYRAGRYAIRPPPVSVARWDETAWINYIENGGGRWLSDGTYRRVCAWCQAVLTMGDPGAPVTHTICEPCSRAFLEEPSP